MASNSTDPHCGLWPDNPSRCDVVEVVQKICPSLSVVGCMFVVMVIWLFKMYRVFVQRLICALAFSACLQSVSYLIGNVYSHSSHTVCYIQAFMMQYFLWATLSWVILITVNMILIVKGIEGKKYELFYHAFAWLNPLLWSLIPYLLKRYGNAGIWCWITKEYPMLRFGVWYLPLLIICILMSLAYAYLFCINKKRVRTASTVYRSRKTEENKIYKREVKPLLVYPLIYIILTIPIFIYRLYDALHPDKPPEFGLLITVVLFSPSVGSCNAIAYAFFNETIRKLTWDKFKQACHERIFGKAYHVRPFQVDDIQDAKPSDLDGSSSNKEISGEKLPSEGNLISKTPSREALQFHNPVFNKKMTNYGTSL